MRISRLEFITIFLACSLSSLFGIIYSVVNADPEKHWDIFNYHLGYLEIYANNSIFVNEYFGQGFEIYLQSIYFIAGLFWLPKNEYELILFNSIIFYIMYPISAVMFAYALRNHYKKGIDHIHKLIFNTSILVLMAFIPLGAPLQLARQCISFCLVLIVASLIMNTSLSIIIKNFFLSSVILLAHTGSLLLAPIFVYLKKDFIIYLLGFSILAANIFVMKFEPTNAISNIFFWVETDYFSNYYMNLYGAILIFSMFLNYRYWQIADYILVASILSFVALPYGFLSRIFYSLEWIIFPFIVIIRFIPRNGKNKYSLHFIRYSAIMILFTKLFIIIN